MSSSAMSLKVGPMKSGAVQRASAWRPFPRDVANVLCVDEATPSVSPRINGRLAITLIQSPSVVRLESSKSLVAERHWILVVPAGQLYAVRAQDSTRDRAFTLLVDSSDLHGVAAVRGPVLVRRREQGEQLAGLLSQFRRPLRSLELAIATRSWLERVVGECNAVASVPARAPAWLESAREYLRAHLCEPVPTATLTCSSGFTEWHFIRAFHREFGLPPHAYHVHLRLAAACELLSEGLPVSTAAYECGFADQSHLSRKFKDVYGMTPAVWAAAVVDTSPLSARRGALRSVVGRVAQSVPASDRRSFAAGS